MQSRVRLYRLLIIFIVAVILTSTLIWQGLRRGQRPTSDATLTSTRTQSSNLNNQRSVSTRRSHKTAVTRRSGILRDRRHDANLPQGSNKSTLGVAARSETSPFLASVQNDLAESREGEGEELTEKETRGDQPDEAARFRRLQLQDENGIIPADGLQNAVQQMSVMRVAQEQRAKVVGLRADEVKIAGLSPADWFWLGPGNIGGRIRSIVIDPNNANKMWVGSVGGGIWRSIDGGASWAPVNDFLANLAVSSMIINPTNPNILYAGTGEDFTAPDGLQGGGVFQSTDAGASWNLLATTNPGVTPPPAGCGLGAAPCPVFWQFVNRLAISPNGNTILAATNRGIARSIDGGATWIQRSANQTFDLDFDPNNGSRAIASDIVACVPPCNPPARVVLSTNAGDSWTASSFGVPLIGRIELAYAPSVFNVIYAQVDQNLGELYSSNDFGQTFVPMNIGKQYVGGQGGYDNILWVNPLDFKYIVVGGLSLYISRDSGVTLTGIADGGNGSAHSDHHMIVSSPLFNNTTNRTVYFANDGGLYKTDDIETVSTTAGWVNLNHNLGITQFYGGAASASGVIFGGTQDNGSPKIEPQANISPPYDPETWSFVAGGDGGFVAADPTDPNYLYLEYTSLTLRRSTNGGQSAPYIYCNPAPPPGNGGVCTSNGILDAQNGANFVAPFILDPSNSNTLLAGGLSLWRSTDIKSAGLPTWTVAKSPNPTIPPPPPPPAPPPAPIPNPISAIVVSPNNSNFIVVGHNDGQIFSTLNGTAAVPNWNPINAAPLPARFVTRLAIDNTRSPNWIYATFGGFSADNVYVTKDLGVTWTDVTGTGATGLPNIPVRSLVINPANANQLYVGTEVGIFASDDAGATWQIPQDGPAKVSVDELFWSQGYLTAATHGRGMYQTRAPVFETNKCSLVVPTCIEGCVVGQWNCPCTWNNHKVPTANDDVSIACPITVTSNTQFVRNLSVSDRLTLNGSIFVQGNITNTGTIEGTGELRATNLLNVRPDPAVTTKGIISVGRIEISGDVANEGIIAASSAWSPGQTYRFECNNLTLTGDATLSAASIFSHNNLSVSTGATVSALSADQTLPPALVVTHDVHNDGLINSAGNISLPFGAFTHTLSGIGRWQAASFSISDPFSGNGAIVSLNNNLRLDVSGQTFISKFSTLKHNNKDVTINGGTLLNNGVIDVGLGNFNFNGNKFESVIPTTNAGTAIKGGGTVNLGFTGSSTIGITSPFQPSFHLLSGTVDAQVTTSFERSFTIDSGSTFNFNQGRIEVNGDLFVGGTLGKTSPSSSSTTLVFNGESLTNNGSISTDNFIFNQSGLPLAQSVAGNGTWPKGQFMRIGSPLTPSTTVLQNNVTVNYDAFGIATGSSLNTGPFTFTLPCSTSWNTVFGTGEVTGTVSRTNLPACFGAIAFGHAFTTIQFTSGTAPTEISVTHIPGSVIDFPNSIQRDYRIFTTGGSGYAATLRLHYLDSELNGNDELNLQLFRNDVTGWTAQGATARDTTDNWVERSGVTQFSPWVISSQPAPSPTPTPSPSPSPTPTPAGTIQFSNSATFVSEGVVDAVITVTRTGDTSATASVNYATSDTAGSNGCADLNGVASSRCDYLTTLGTLSLAVGETSKTIVIPIIDDVYAEGMENFTLTLSSPVGATLGVPATASLTINDNETINGANPIDNASFFVRQHYVDFLNREPDAAGLSFWADQINLCGTDAQCTEVKRINVSAAFFLSIEFQETGYLVYRTYKSAFGNLPGAPVPVRFTDFLRDTQQIGQGVRVGIGNWETQLENNKQAFALAFVQRPDFQTAFPNSLTAQQFVDQLDVNADGALSGAERTTLLGVLGATPSDLSKRASVLRSVAEDATLRNAEFNRAFVLMQYFGYMRRNPNDAPDTDFAGYNFWLGKLNQFHGNFVQAELVKAFITSIEYRQRFGP
jgi:hypothetical protein